MKLLSKLLLFFRRTAGRTQETEGEMSKEKKKASEILSPESRPSEYSTITDTLTEIYEEENRTGENEDCFENRELSWLRFNARVLEEAADPENPLCERLGFLSIYQTNLDEFFMVRVGSLHDRMIIDDNERDNKTFMSPGEQIRAIMKRVRKLSKKNTVIYGNIMDSLKDYGIRLTNFASLEENEAAYLEAFFMNEVLPQLSPVIVGKKNPFPFLDNESLYAFCILKKKEEKDRIGIIPCTVKSLDRLIQIPGHKGQFMLLEELVLHFLPLVYKKFEVGEKAVIRITRNADIDADAAYDEDIDYRELMSQLIRSRKRLAPVRLEYSRAIDKKTVKRLASLLNIDPERAFLQEMPLELSFFSILKNELYRRTDLFFEKRQPQKSPEIREDLPMIPQIEKKDLLLYYPYERMNPMIRLLQEAAKDPEVTSIQMTLYRLAKNSQIVDALIAAREAGKRVDVLVELKARFDEENNIHWSHLLEDAGCNVLYGLGRYKVHSKLLLITREQNGETSFITQIGTGNYNENTARFYTDLCFMTARREIGLEAKKVFDALLREELPGKFEHLLVAPESLQDRVLRMMDEEIECAKAGGEGYIGLKLNSITDKDLILKLIEASQAGVKIEMVVRGINCLRSGIPGKTDNIRIVSIVGRFLEHARIYIFGRGERERMYISSADFMTRNTLRRVEVGAPIEAPELREKIRRIFNLQLSDNVKAREQRPSGSYKHVEPSEGEAPLNSQEEFLRKAYRGEV